MKISKFEILTNFQEKLKNSKSFDKFKKEKRGNENFKVSHKFKKNIKFKQIKIQNLSLI